MWEALTTMLDIVKGSINDSCCYEDCYFAWYPVDFGIELHVPVRNGINLLCSRYLLYSIFFKTVACLSFLISMSLKNIEINPWLQS